MDPEEIAKILKDRIDEEEAATGERSSLRDQPIRSLPINTPNVLDDVPGFTKQGDPDAPYFVPTLETKKSFVPMADDQQAPSSIDDSPKALAPVEPDTDAQLRALIPDAFERAAQATRRFATSGGREEGTATKVIEQGGPAIYRALDKLAKDATEQSSFAAQGEDYNPKPIVDAAQVAIPGKGALLLGGGLMAAELGAKNQRPLSGTPQELADLLVPPAEAKTDQEKLIEAARKRLAPEVDPAEQLRRLGQDRLSGGDVPTEANAPINAPKLPRAPKQRSEETPEQFAVRQNAYLEEKKKFYSTYTPTAQRIFDTVGGPRKVDPNTTENLVTGAFLISAGMILAPRVFRAFKSTVTAPPRSLKDALTLQPGVFGEQKGQGFFNPQGGRAVRDAMPGTKAYSTPVDLARSADDINRVALGIGAKNGIIPAVQEQLENTFGIYSRSNARHLTESAVETGRMETPAFRFRAPVSLAEMQRTFTPEMKQYINMRDTFESLVERSRLPPYAPGSKNPAPGLPMITGQTTTTLSPIIRAMELAHPEVIPAARAWEQWNRAVRKFQSTGEYATIPKNNPNPNPATPNKSEAYQNAQHRWEVPWAGRKQDRGMPAQQRLQDQDPIQMQSRYSKIDLQERLNNEAIGQYIDAIRQAKPDSFVRVGRTARETEELLAENPRYLKNTVTMYRRGQKEVYTTDPLLADALKMDPYVITHGAGQFIYAAKRGVEFGATGLGAPFFAATSMLRSWQIGKYTADAGYRSPSLIGSIAAVPQQLYPMLARGIARSYEAGSGGLLSRFAGNAWVDSLAQRAAGEYNASLYAQLQRVGSSRGSILEHERITTGLDELRHAINQYTSQPGIKPFSPFLNGYKNLLEAIHNGPAYNYVRKNLSVAPMPQLAARARNLTGDPRKAGQYYFEPVGGGKAQGIRYERGGSVSHTIGDIAARTMMVPTELIGRTAVPWFNATQQGIKRIGEAYLNDPVKFTRSMWLYAGMPAAAEYLYAHALGNDPKGQSYVDYMMNRRSSYNRQMNWYIPIPGRNAEDGVELPGFHEMRPAARMTSVGMDHMLGNANNTLRDDYWKAANMFVDTAIIPPLPPIVGGPMALMGVNPPMGLPLGSFGGEAYSIKTDPFDQLGGMPANIEALARAVGGGAATTIGQGYAAFTQTPEGFTKAITNAGTEMGKSIISRTPMIRDITGILPPMSGNTDVRKELFDKQKEIDQLLKFYSKWDKNAGKINTDPASKGGGAVAEILMGPVSAGGNPGISQPPPTNPLYIKFMADVYNRFKRESPNYVKGEDQGGIGFRSLWRRYGDASEALKMLRPINDGNNVTWQAQLKNEPAVLEELNKANVDSKNLREVKNYYTLKQQDAARVILNTIRAVEEDFSKLAGKPIKLKDLNPYQGKPLEDAPFAYPDVVDEVSRNWNQGAPAP
jgi:hypothetical protein